MILNLFSIKVKLLTLLPLFFVEAIIANNKNPTVYPFGGIQDSSRFLEWMSRSPLYFTKANFNDLIFDSFSDFSYSKFGVLSNFESSRFKFPVDFSSVSFDSIANFKLAEFDSIANFNFTEFLNSANFNYAKFYHTVDLRGSNFYGPANFRNAEFYKSSDFGEVEFHSFLDLKQSEFKTIVNFSFTKFDSLVDFSYTSFDSLANFSFCEFKNEVDFRETKFDSLNFDRTRISDKLIIGSKKQQKFDFTRTIFSPKAKIKLSDLVELRIQPEKFEHISFYDKLAYNLKRLIIDNLNEKSFKEDKKAQFELEYILAKSTIFQKPGDTYTPNKWFYIWKWPKWSLIILYYLTMGLGYRPFWLAYWILILIFFFTGIYWKNFPVKINEYIDKNFGKEKKETSSNGNITIFDNFINCIYFSSMVLFTFRLKGDILIFFDSKQKKIIVTEWVLGSIIYVAFLSLSKSGSILHTLKSLLFG